MANLRLSNVSKEFGGRVILNGVTAEFNSGEIVGLVGANGTGKTTLFRIVDRQLEPDSGNVAGSKGLRIGYLTQDPAINPENTLFDEVATAFEEIRRLEHQQHDISDRMATTAPGPELDALMADYDKVHARFLAAGGYQLESRMNEILGGLGFATTDYELPMSALSGGQQCRAALARLLLEENTFLLLDEPTNHLDIDAVAWLEKFLAGHTGGALVISHDRYLLDRIVDRIIELDNAQLASFPGNYSNYVKTRDTRRLTAERQFKDDQEFIAKERAFITKHMGKQRTAEAKGRLKRLERRLAAGEFATDRPQQRQSVKLKFETSGEIAPEGWVFDVQELSKAYDDKQLFSDLSFQVQAGQRLGITGPNGTGKSTLLKIVLGMVEPDSGVVRIDPRADIGYFAQDSGQMTAENTLVEELLESNPEFSESAARSQLARFRFFGDDVFKTIGTLSGGERARLRLLQLILRQPNVIVLDEPTNHLDIPSREVLENALEDFPGAIVAVSHDRYFLDRIVSHVLVIRPNQHELHPGNYSSYAEALEERRRTADAAKRPSGSKKKKGAPKAASGAQKKRNPHEKKSLAEIEELIIEHESKLAELSQMFGDEEIYSNPERLAELEGEVELVQANLNELEAAWELKAAEE